MDTLEVLTLVLVIFAALSYIDDHNKKKQHPYPEKVRCYFNTFYTTEGKSESHPIHFLSRLYNGVLEKSSTLFLEFPYFYPHFPAFTGSAINNFQKMPKI